MEQRLCPWVQYCALELGVRVHHLCQVTFGLPLACRIWGILDQVAESAIGFEFRNAILSLRKADLKLQMCCVLMSELLH